MTFYGFRCFGAVLGLRLKLRSHSTRQIFDRWKIRVFGRFVHMELRQTYENLDAQAFKTLKTKIEDEFLGDAVNNLSATV